jgi:hypothetical protein
MRRKIVKVEIVYERNYPLKWQVYGCYLRDGKREYYMGANEMDGKLRKEAKRLAESALKAYVFNEGKVIGLVYAVSRVK